MEQSIGLLAVSVALLLAATVPSPPAVRAAAAFLGSLAIVGLLVLAPFPLGAVEAVGDYDTYSGNLTDYLAPGFRMEAPLGWAILSVIWTLLGRTAAAAPAAFGWLTALFTVALLTGLNVVAWLDRWSARSLRYLALCCAAPSMLLFLGYREFAFLPLALAATALPLLMLGIERGTLGLFVASFVLLGVGGAVHAFGLITLVAALAGIVAARVPPQVVVRCAVVAVCSWGVWFVLFLIAGTPLSIGHANHLDLRELFDRRVDYVHRTKPGLLTPRGARDVAMMFILGGLTLCWPLARPVTASLKRRHSEPALLAAVAILVPTAGAAALIWPIQGLAIDTDIVMGLSPAFYVLAWFVAGRSTLAACVSWLLLAASHGAFWWVVRSDLFVN